MDGGDTGDQQAEEQVPPELARMSAEYVRIVDEVVSDQLSLDEAEAALGKLCVFDGAGARWTMDGDGFFTRQTSQDQPIVVTDPAKFIPPISRAPQPAQNLLGETPPQQPQPNRATGGHGGAGRSGPRRNPAAQRPRSAPGDPQTLPLFAAPQPEPHQSEPHQPEPHQPEPHRPGGTGRAGPAEPAAPGNPRRVDPAPVGGGRGPSETVAGPRQAGHTDTGGTGLDLSQLPRPDIGDYDQALNHDEMLGHSTTGGHTTVGGRGTPRRKAGPGGDELPAVVTSPDPQRDHRGANADPGIVTRAAGRLRDFLGGRARTVAIFAGMIVLLIVCTVFAPKPPANTKPGPDVPGTTTTAKPSGTTKVPGTTAGQPAASTTMPAAPTTTR